MLQKMSRKRKKKKRQKPSSSRRKSTKRNVPLNEFPFDVDSELRKAVQYHRSGQLQKARGIYEKLLEINPYHSRSLYLLGVIAHQTGRADTAVNLINKAIQNDPRNPIYYNNLANMFQDLGKLNEAISCFEKAVQLRPDYVEAYSDMGIAFKDLGKLNEAISCFEKAVQLRPGVAGVYNNMGNALQRLGKVNEAISYYQKAVQIEPDYAEAYYNMGSAYHGLDNADESIVCYQKALHIRPDYAEAYSERVHQLRRICAWQELEGSTATLEGLTRTALRNGRKPAESPFVSLSRHLDLSSLLAIAKSWSSDIVKRISKWDVHFSFNGRRSPKVRITIGYLSNDFRDHATGHLMLSLFGLHSRDEFEIFCYSYGQDDGSFYRAQILRDCDKFVDLCNVGHADAARCIYEDDVDILVDLKGYTEGNRLGICALRPAPIQVSYLGFPGTTGADFFDYIVTDRMVTPEDHADHYSENFLYLPHCYQVNDHTQAISNKDFKRTDFGLPEGGFVFFSFNNPYKIDPVMFDTWMKTLRQIPESVLWLLWGNETAEKNLRQEAEARGVKSERLIFAKRLPKDEHLARLRLADLALDTRIVNGHTTTSDALWAGVPVITLMGSHFASRVSASILAAIGLSESITHSLEDYEALAVRLAQNPDELHAIRERLAENRLTEPLFDTPRFARNLEKAYKEMWKIFLAGETPRQIEVVEV